MDYNQAKKILAKGDVKIGVNPNDGMYIQIVKPWSWRILVTFFVVAVVFETVIGGAASEEIVASLLIGAVTMYWCYGYLRDSKKAKLYHSVLKGLDEKTVDALAGKTGEDKKTVIATLERLMQKNRFKNIKISPNQKDIIYYYDSDSFQKAELVFQAETEGYSSAEEMIEIKKQTEEAEKKAKKEAEEEKKRLATTVVATRLIDSGVVQESHGKTKMGSMAGRAVVGGALLGPAGAIIGGATAKKKVETVERDSGERTFLVQYANGNTREEKVKVNSRKYYEYMDKLIL